MAVQLSMATQDACGLLENLTGTAHCAEKASRAEERPQLQGGIKSVSLQSFQ